MINHWYPTYIMMILVVLSPEYILTRHVSAFKCASCCCSQAKRKSIASGKSAKKEKTKAKEKPQEKKETGKKEVKRMK